MSNITFGTTDLSTLGIAVNSISGWYDLVGTDVQRVLIPGRQWADQIDQRRSGRTVKLHCVASAADHAAFVTAMATIRAALSPEQGYLSLTRVDDPTKRFLARCLGFPISEEGLPFIHWGREFDLVFECLCPWREDVTPVTATNLTSTLVNDGDIATDALWTCTVSGTLATGLWFDVAGQLFTYEGALASTDVLTVTTDLADVRKNGTRNFADVADAAVFPLIEPGSNVIQKSSSSFTLDATYRRRYE